MGAVDKVSLCRSLLYPASKRISSDEKVHEVQHQQKEKIITWKNKLKESEKSLKLFAEDIAKIPDTHLKDKQDLLKKWNDLCEVYGKEMDQFQEFSKNYEEFLRGRGQESASEDSCTYQLSPGFVIN